MTDVVDAFCSQRHYAEHLQPILDAIPAEIRGRLYAPRPVARTLPGSKEGTAPNSTMPVLVAGYQDLVMARRPKVLVQHGAGQTYRKVTSGSYAGGPGHEAVDLFISPNERCAALEAERYPRARSVAVGCPKLDGWAQIPRPVNERPTVAVTFHWDAHLKTYDGELIPEAGTAFISWRDTITALSKTHHVLGHGHPRFAGMAAWWASVGIEHVTDPADLLARADVLVGDNTSLLYEWAALDRPVIFMRDDGWRDIHGLRFGDPLPGPEVLLEDRDSLDALIDFMALERWEPWAADRARVSARVYGPVDGQASDRAATAVLDLVAHPAGRQLYKKARDCGC